VSDFQAEKQIVIDYYKALDKAPIRDIAATIDDAVGKDYLWRGYHPFNEMTSAQEIADKFWKPFRQSFSRMQRRQDVFMAGRNQIDDFKSVWVVSMGNLMGLFDAPWLNIPPTGKMTFMRYCEFNKVENGKIVDTAMFIDIPMVMMQAGLNPFPTSTGAQIVQPGPITHDALMFDAQDPTQGQATLDAINRMVADLGDWDNKLTLEQELALSWHDDMIWWGPTGIGATYTIERYAKQHSGPFRAGFKDRIFNGHVAKIGEGNFGGFFGWPNLTLIPTGGFMGMPGSELAGDMRVIDIYRRDGDKLAENWVFIDLLHFWKSQGLDVLERHATLIR
jgi:hypothetical protein